MSFAPLTITRISLLLGSAIVSLLAAEGICRMLNVGNPAVAVWEEERLADMPPAYQPNSGLVYRYPDNPRGYFNDLNEVWGSINSSGFRGPERGVSRPLGAPRVAFLGDSFTLGIGVRDADTLPAQFERAMQVDSPGLEALNFGVSGSSTPQQVELLEKQVVEFRPDIVILVLFLNDAGRRGTTEFLGAANEAGKPLGPLRRHSFFVNALVGGVEAARLHEEMVDHYRSGYTDGRPGWEAVKAAIQKGDALSAEHDFEWIVALYPVLYRLDERYPFLDVHRSIARFVASAGIPFVDLFESLRGQRDLDLWVHRTDQHPNEIAHALAAQALADRVRKLRASRELASDRPRRSGATSRAGARRTTTPGRGAGAR